MCLLRFHARWAYIHCVHCTLYSLKCARISALDANFLSGNSLQTIQHCFRNLQHNKFSNSCADVAKESGRKGSNVYEVNQWWWRFGRGQRSLGPLGGLSVSETEVRRLAAMLY